MIVNAESAVKAPDALSDEEASTLPIAAVTARFSLMDYGNLQPGQTVLLQGTGVVSIFAVQIASAYGARVIATSSRDENLLKVKALGAWEGITYKQNPAWEKRALELTDGKGVDFQFEVVEKAENLHRTSDKFCEQESCRYYFRESTWAFSLVESWDS